MLPAAPRFRILHLGEWSCLPPTIHQRTPTCSPDQAATVCSFRIATHSHPNPQPSQSIAHSPAADVGHGPRPAWLLLTAVWAGQFLHHGLLVRAVTRQTRRGAVTNRHRLGCPSLGIRLHPFAMPAACLSRQMLVQVRAKEQWDVDVKHAFEYIKGKVRPSAMPQALVGLGPWAWPLRMREGPNM